MKIQLIGLNGVPVISLPEGYDLLEAFIGTNLQDKDEDGIWIIDSINEVLSGAVEYSTLGDVKYFVIELKKVYVKIILPYGEQGEYCEVPTLVFKNIIVEWLKQKKEYYSV